LTLLRMIFGVPESSPFELLKVFRGFRSSLDAMWAEVSTLNLMKTVPGLEVPVFFFLGRKDHVVPAEISAAYFDVLTAPSKELVWFEKSGHEPFVDEPARFNTAMAELVRPACRGDA
jgi:pimeloyl-ACP methyl ester carboxylesterase